MMSANRSGLGIRRTIFRQVAASTSVVLAD